MPLGGEVAYLGLGGAPTATEPGATLRLSPRFLSLRPLTQDYSVSVGLKAIDGSWERKSDGTPALGAIPTLKWLGGWIVEDPHDLALRSDTPDGEAAITLSLYDAFTLAPLQVLDERLVRQGQGTYIEMGRMQIVGN